MSLTPEFPSGLPAGDRVRPIRERKGMSRPVLAGPVGMSPAWLWKIESGRRPIHSLTHWYVSPKRYVCPICPASRVIRSASLPTPSGSGRTRPCPRSGRPSTVLPSLRRRLWLRSPRKLSRPGWIPPGVCGTTAHTGGRKSVRCCPVFSTTPRSASAPGPVEG
ncbi:helix-turn-helix domain-containing protein [Nonomuraea longicatena]|uniref:helix-turn-helix domain-containing protein n=1 Tax=Nonomuraea longicatena TaxID=83682 RepID=UPI003CD070ED